jgi:hypothetical protein
MSSPGVLFEDLLNVDLHRIAFINTKGRTCSDHSCGAENQDISAFGRQLIVFAQVNRHPGQMLGTNFAKPGKATNRR